MLHDLSVFFSQQEKPKRIDPLDYETVISELAEDLKEDPLRELLLFPDNDFSVSAILCLCPVRETVGVKVLGWILDETAVYCIWRQTANPLCLHVHVFGLWEEACVAINPHRIRENIQTPLRKA